jgi:hypothetical protein
MKFNFGKTYNRPVQDGEYGYYNTRDPNAVGKQRIGYNSRRTYNLQTYTNGIKYNSFQSDLKTPAITITKYSRGKIGKVDGVNRCSVEFYSDTDLYKWEARANGNSGHGKGLLVGDGNSLKALETGAFDVDYDELTLGDKEYTISVYGMSMYGVWSDE